MTMLVQLQHAPPALDLGEKLNHLFLFQCTSEELCPSYDYLSGAGKAFILQERDLIENVPCLSVEAVPITELKISSWESCEDHITSDLAIDFFDSERYTALPEWVKKPWGISEKSETKFGGVPLWTTNGPSGYPPPPYEYFGQVGQYLHLDTFRTKETWEVIRRRFEGLSAEQALDLATSTLPLDESSRIEFANFGSDGVAYIFLDRTAPLPKAVWFWNR